MQKSLRPSRFFAAAMGPEIASSFLALLGAHAALCLVRCYVQGMAGHGFGADQEAS